MVVKYVQCRDSKMLIYRHEKRRKRRKSDVVDSIINRNCHRNGHYANDFKCYSYILIYAFIVATIMMLSLPTTIAMNQNQIENNEIAINDVQPIIQMDQPNNHHARKVDGNYHRPFDSIGMVSLLSLTLKKELTTSRENVNQLIPTKKMNPTICNCSDGKMLPIQMVNCMQICAKYSKSKMLLTKMLRTPNDRHDNEHENENEIEIMHDSATKQKQRYDESVAINKRVQWQRDDSIIRIQSSDMSGNCSKIPLKLATIQNVSQKSVNNISQRGINEKNVKFHTRKTATATTKTNLNEHFYSANHQMMVKNGSINQTKRNNQDGANEHENKDEIHKMNFDPTMAQNDDNPNVFNYKLNVKREMRSVEMQPNQIQQPNKMQEQNMNETEVMTMMEMMKNVRFSEAYHQQTASSPETNVPFYRKQTINEFLDSTETQGAGVRESNGPIFDANRTTVSIILRNQNESDPFDYANFLIKNNNGAIKSEELRNDYDNVDVILSNQFISGQHVDVLEANNNFVGSTVATAIRTTRMAHTLIDDSNGAGNSTSIDDENTNLVTNRTCVGDPLYCNLTEAEYREMLYEYIFPTTGEWILIGFHGAVFTVGLVGNVLVCIAVYANATMRTVTNIFIVNLAIADLLVIILCLPPTVVWDVTETWFLGEAMCKGVLYLQTVSVTVSVLTLTFISIDRWYAICFPLRYVSTNGRAWCSVALIWIAALLSDIPEFINSTIEKKELRFDVDLFTQCVSTWDKDTEKNVYIARFGMLYVLPLFLMSVAYFKIICVLWRSDTIPGHRESRNQTHAINNTRTSTVGNTSTMSQLRARRKAAKMLVAVVIMFAICYFPVHCLNIIRYTVNIEQSEVITILSLISHWLCYANSAVNPLIYNFMSGKFRREFVSVLDRCRCSHHDVHSHHSFYLNAQAARLNTISPNTRSMYHYTSQRDRHKSFREKQTLQTSFVENVCDIYTGSMDENNQKYKVNSNGKSHQPL